MVVFITWGVKTIEFFAGVLITFDCEKISLAFKFCLNDVHLQLLNESSQ